MNRTVNRHSLKWYLILFFAIAAFVVTGINPAKAFQNKKADTVSSADVQFTDIPTAADSAKAFQKKQAELKKQQTTTAAITVSANEAPKTLWEIFIKGFLGGFAAFLLPCVYPMLPLTVSFFTKKGGTRSKAIFQSLLYGLSIVFIYVVFGLIITIAFGPAALNGLATNGIFNLGFFLLLLVFGISFLGAFEITLPSSFANKLDANSDKGGLVGIFFMAATLVVVSFSCTGPAIGFVLVDAVSKGERLAPAVVMLGFSLAIALPFTLFAMFPSLLKSLPKSGGWLNSVKVMLGFIEIGFALKFLSNVDLAYHWNWFDREIFLSLWIGIGILMVLYLMGKIKFSHDSDLPYMSVPRTFITLIILAFTVYMIPGLWGAPLKVISGFLPPPATQDFDLTRINTNSAAPVQNVSIKEKKYEDVFKRGKHAGLNEWYDYDQALQVSKELKKPILIDFTGWNCANCRKMENDVWPDPRVRKMMQNDFVLLELYVDEKKAQLPASEVYTSTFSGKQITTVGGKNTDYETVKFNTNSQPFYVIIDGEGNTLVPPQGANFSADNYVNYLTSGLEVYKNKK